MFDRELQVAGWAQIGNGKGYWKEIVFPTPLKELKVLLNEDQREAPLAIELTKRKDGTYVANIRHKKFCEVRVKEVKEL